ncbi:MAG: Ig-like domain-containing protein [Chitinophagales bacterium]|nr:Ig-like domain-containing protein [Bacteroidota bacterium]
MRYFRIVFTLFVLILVLSACAKVVAPEGGDQDTTPPKILKQSIANGSTNITPKRIEFETDENIQIGNSSEIIVTPRPPKPWTFTARGKKLQITLSDSLVQNTTYNIQFREELKDYNEGNPLSNYNFVFSTGDKIDSTTLSGKVIFDENGKPLANAMVGLYAIGEDSLLLRSAPDYFTKSDKEGNFTLSFIKPNDYYLLAFEDSDNNRVFDNEKDNLAFSGTPISISAQKDSLAAKPLILIASKHKKPASYLGDIQKHNNYQWQIPIVNAENFHNFSTNKQNDRIKLYLNEQKDSLNIWFKDTINEDFKIILQSDNQLFDTTEIVYKTIKKEFNDSLYVVHKEISEGRVGFLDYFKNFVLFANQPIGKINGEKVLLMQDSILATFDKLYITKDNPQKLMLDYAWQANKTYTLILLPEALYAWRNNTTALDSLQIFEWKTYAEEEYGVLYINVNSNYVNNNWRFILSNNRATQKIDTLITQSEMKINRLKPGKYSLFLYNDRNNNQKRDIGNWWEKKPAETLYFYDKEIQILANWETEVPIPLFTPNEPTKE